MADDGDEEPDAGLSAVEGTEDPGLDAVLRAVARARHGELMASAEMREGEVLSHFSIISQLGHGGMGVVYLAHDTSLHRRVALKVLPAHAASDPKRRLRLLREARAAAAVKHPNIASIFEVGEVDGRVFIAMEYVDGEDLRTRMRRGRLEVGEAVAIARQILAGLAASHAAGLIHRDLKPDNVMLARDGTVRILDFGIAKWSGSTDDLEPNDAQPITREGEVLGTPAYMSPEQALGEDVDARTDIFSFGVMLFEMLVGVRPFGVGNKSSVMRALFDTEPEAPARLRPEVSTPLSTLVLTCLAKSPAHRYANVAAVSAALDAVGTDAPLSARGWWRVAAALIGGVLVTYVGLSRYEDLAPSSAGEAHAFELACPPLRVASLADGWLGAAAAGIACERARVMLGGRPDRVRVPAELLELPGRPVDGFPTDPYSQPGARARALEVAQRSDAHLDGEVTFGGGLFEVRLELRAKGETLARGAGSSRALYAAVRSAMLPLVEAGALRRVATLDPEIAPWSRVKGVEIALTLLDAAVASDNNAGTLADECARLHALGAEIGEHGLYADWFCAYVRGDPLPSIVAPVLDPKDPAALVSALWISNALDQALDRPLLARQLEAARKQESSRWGRSLLAAAESCVLLPIDPDRARSAALIAVGEEPLNPDGYGCAPGYSLSVASFGTATAPGSGHRWTAWEPWNGTAWTMLASTATSSDLRFRYSQRAYRLSPLNTTTAALLADALLARGQREEARAIAVDLAANDAPVHRAQAEIVFLRVEASEARFDAALKRTKRALQQLRGDGFARALLLEMASRGLEIALVLGRERELADEIVTRLIEPVPTRLDRHDFNPIRGAEACALASPAASRRCFQRFRTLFAEGFFESPGPATEPVFRGAELYARRDRRGAAAVWRPVSAQWLGDDIGALTHLMASVFDELGDHELANRIDAPALSRRGELNGANLAYVRAARRAAPDDPARAVRLAQAVIEAWSTADALPPTVDEMRKLIARARPMAAK